tara:strand:- start:798 stop:1049 length:252 start_codon:yes stop_codon:yes gene_type:complete
MMKRTAVIALPLAAMLGLAACSQAKEDKTYEADAVDQSGGELIVTDEDPNAVPVDTPDTAMTPVPTEEASPSAMPSAETTPDE